MNKINVCINIHPVQVSISAPLAEITAYTAYTS